MNGLHVLISFLKLIPLMAISCQPVVDSPLGLPDEFDVF